MTSYKYQNHKQHASNYNYKTRKSFGQRIKNFFTIPEEDLKEEPSKEFEKIKLFTLTRGSLFLGILVFMILINILVGFNINFLYLRQIFGFLFLILIPGLLIMLCFKIRTVKFWEYLVYTVGLSIAFIMFAGLAVNWTLPALNITDKPLSLWPILICFDIFLLGLWLTAIYRNKDLKPFDITIPKLDTLNRIFFIIPMFFPLLSILGAFLLNNHGSNILTMIMLGGIAVYVLLLVIFRKHMNENIWPWALWMIGLALLLSFSLRGWYITGIDIHQELKIAKLVLLNNYWSMDLFKSAYNSCLSLSILSPILSLFLKLDIAIVFKLIIQVIFSLSPVIIYCIYKNIIKDKSLIFLACFFFISQIFFIEQMPQLIRQEISYIFFSLFFLTLFSRKTESYKLLLLIFGFSIIVSHYSSSYIFLFSIFSAYLIIILLRKIPRLKNEKISSFSLTLLILLLTFSFLWTSQVTQTSEGLTSTIYNTFANSKDLFKQDSKSEIIQGLMFKKIDYYSAYKNYSSESSVIYQENVNLDILKSNESVNYAPPIIREVNNYPFYKLFFYMNSIISIYFKLIILCGIFVCSLFIKQFRSKEYFVYASIYFIIILLIAILPYISFNYNFERAFLQSLIILSLTTICAGYILFKLIFKDKNISLILLSIMSILFLLFSSLSFPSLFLGGKGDSIIFDNYKIEFSTLYANSFEINSIIWIDNYSDKKYNFYFDRYARLKVWSTVPNFKSNIFNDITSNTIDKSSYIFSSFSNTFGLSTVYYNGVLFNIKYPQEFLVTNKDKIYNNGGSEIFK